MATIMGTVSETTQINVINVATTAIAGLIRCGILDSLILLITSSFLPPCNSVSALYRKRTVVAATLPQ